MTLAALLATLVIPVGELALVASESAQLEAASSPVESSDLSLPHGLSPTGLDPRFADTGRLEAFLDGVMGAQMREKSIAGAVVAVVGGGQILVAKGYGHADADRQSPVDPASTLFRIGSVTKLFTWIAVMQQVEVGALDLDTDVNAYLDFRIPDHPGGPITLRHLLTHTPGFEEDSRDLFIDEVDLGGWLAPRVPARVRAPGEFGAYSNYGTALAGYIVERTSGLPWDDYLETRILLPLGMTWSTGRQPLPAELASHMSQGLEWRNGRWEERPFEILGGSGPAGSMSATGMDMARFMMAMLPSGRQALQGVLAPETLDLMMDRAFVHDPRVNAQGLGFYEKSSHGLRIVGHGGNTRWFHTDLALIPELDLGIFVSYNSDRGGELSFGPFLSTLLDHYFPQPRPTLVPLEGWEDRLAAVSGTWRFNRASYTTFQKAVGLVSGFRAQPATEDGVLLFPGLMGGQMRMMEEEPFLFRELVGETRLAFRVDEEGRATHAFLSVTPMIVLERAHWSTLPALHLPILGGGLVLFVGVILSAVGRVFRRIRQSRSLATSPPHPEPGPGFRRARRLLVGTAMCYLAFVVGAAILLSDPWSILSSPFTGLGTVLAFPVLASLLALVAAAFWVLAIRRGEEGRWIRWRIGAMVAVSGLMAWSLHTWNLLGWRF